MKLSSFSIETYSQFIRFSDNDSLGAKFHGPFLIWLALGLVGSGLSIVQGIFV